MLTISSFWKTIVSLWKRRRKIENETIVYENDSFLKMVFFKKIVFQNDRFCKTRYFVNDRNDDPSLTIVNDDPFFNDRLRWPFVNDR